MSKKIFFFIVLIAPFLFSCEQPEGRYKSENYTLGTFVQVELLTKKENAEAFLKEFNQLSKQQTKDLYAWGNGELVTINTSLKNVDCTPLPVSDDMLSLLMHSKKLSIQSAYLFDPAIKPLIELWGFHRVEEMRKTPPDDVSIQKLLDTSGKISDLEIKENTVCSSKPLELDLGAIAKGWAAHTAIEQLNSNNIENALIGFGGDLIALGMNSNNKKWKVGLKNPNIHWKGFDAPALFEIGNHENTPIAIFTSGDYERQFEHKGKRSHHILDPRTGYPNTDVRSVTVIHSDPILADAAATALHVAGKNWPIIAKQMNLNKVLVLYPNKKAEITPEMVALTTWLDTTYTVKIIN